jgi:NADH:ubiquinone oxidoreductase subunit 4 (subunit M)
MNVLMILFFVGSNENFFFLSAFIIIHGLLSSFMFFVVDVIQKKSFSRNVVTLSGFSIVFPQLSLII